MGRYALVLSASFLFAVGCGGGDPTGPKLVPASGRVTLNGSSLDGASVYFVPEQVEGRNVGAAAVSGSDGKYRLKYRGEKPGAVPGSYKVFVVKYVKPDGSAIPDDPAKTEADWMALGAKNIIPVRYTNRVTTTLKIEVPAAGGDSLNFDLVDAPIKK
ncbi:MAG: hypothetical protein ACRDD1_05985 [Planctomycetia bacterium]